VQDLSIQTKSAYADYSIPNSGYLPPYWATDRGKAEIRAK